MKKFINQPEDVVAEMLEGLSMAEGKLKILKEYGVTVRTNVSGKKVGLVSGGGAGHEPAHAGFVGRGMLDAAVSGNVFASPGPEAILQAVKEADHGSGVLNGRHTAYGTVYFKL